MIPVWVVSTHLDDAVLSLGQSLTSWDGVHVLTVFTDAPAVERHDGWNRATTGETWAPATQARRRDEDRDAVTSLGATAHWLGEHEAEYRPGGQDLAALATAIGGYLEEHDALDVVAPLGLRHSDHLAVADACRRLMTADRRHWRIYLDQPYGHTYPDLVAERLADAAADGLELVEEAPVGVIGTTKTDAVARYASQVDAVRHEHADLDAAMREPERTWSVVRSGADRDAGASTVA